VIAHVLPRLLKVPTVVSIPSGTRARTMLVLFCT
jgi:hypothetical protein